MAQDWLKKTFAPKQARAFTELNTWHADFPLEEVPDILVGQARTEPEDTSIKGKPAKKAPKQADTSQLGNEERVEDMPDIRPAQRSALQTLHRTVPSDKKRVVGALTPN